MGGIEMLGVLASPPPSSSLRHWYWASDHGSMSCGMRCLDGWALPKISLLAI